MENQSRRKLKLRFDSVWPTKVALNGGTVLGDTSLQFKRTRLRHCQPEPGTAGLSATKSIGAARADHSTIHCLPESLFASEAQRCVCGSVRHTGRIIQCRTRTVLVNDAGSNGRCNTLLICSSVSVFHKKTDLLSVLA